VADHAIIYAVDTYPGLTNLAGPSADADAFKAWLVSADGGNVPEANITVIKSSDFPPVQKPYQAMPAEAAFKEALEQLLWEQDEFREAYGRRLYLFFAGHGFAGRQQLEAALYTAQATRRDPLHIAGRRYADRIAASAAFEEVVLIMDCCRDVTLLDAVSDPSLKIPDAAAGAQHVKLFLAFAAGRGQQSRERDFNGRVRGVFTTALLDALRDAKPDADGRVTGALLKGHLLDRWKTYFANGQVDFEPEVVLPGRQDLVVLERAAVPKVEIRITADPAAPAGAFLVVESKPGKEEVRVALNGAPVSVKLESGYYKARIEGTPRAALIDAVGSLVEVSL
jgi:hypothetical protein